MNLVSIVDNVGVQIHSIAGRLNAFIAIKAAGQVDVLGVACGKREYLLVNGREIVCSPSLFDGS